MCWIVCCPKDNRFGSKVAARHLYVHVPFCQGKCRYCALYSERYAVEPARRYLRALSGELERTLAAGELGRAPQTIYFGGGTPTVLSAAQLRSLCALFSARLSGNRPAEWSVEANPATVTEKKMEILAAAGVNRVSFGAQSFDAATLRAMGRRHSVGAVSAAVRMARAAGLDNIGLDLIAGYPGVSLDVWRMTVATALDLRPSHLSVYAWTLEEASELGRRQAGGAAVVATEEGTELLILRETEDVLRAAGYRRYEISNYALPGRECRHNLACWRGEDYAGLGPAAASRLGLRRRLNLPQAAKYADALSVGATPPRDEEVLDTYDDAGERMIFGFRLEEGVEIDRWAPDGAKRDEWETVLHAWAQRGLAEKRGSVWTLTREGRVMADALAGDLV
jgi:oxygen-independent coproporphyrinogen III oxidase